MNAVGSYRRRGIVIAWCLTGALLSGCAFVNSTPPPPSAPPTPVVASDSPALGAACPATVPSTVAVSDGQLRDGKSFGFVHHFDGIALYVDPADFFGNAEAIKAAREDGEIGPGEDLPNPFYIRNRSDAIVRVPISEALRIKVLDNQEAQPHSLSLAAFTSLYCASGRLHWMYSDPAQLPVWITVANGVATKVAEQYVP